MIIQYQQNEYYELQDNMAEVWADATKVHEVNKALKKQSFKKSVYLKGAH